MTIKEIMDRIAGADHEWELDPSWVKTMGPMEVLAGALSGIDPRDVRPFLFNLPVAKLRPKPKSK